jgi:hypothetical protein
MLSLGAGPQATATTAAVPNPAALSHTPQRIKAADPVQLPLSILISVDITIQLPRRAVKAAAA